MQQSELHRCPLGDGVRYQRKENQSGGRVNKQSILLSMVFDCQLELLHLNQLKRRQANGAQRNPYISNYSC